VDHSKQCFNLPSIEKESMAALGVECIPPTKENTKTSHEVEVMFNSHSWSLKKAESQFHDKGVLIRMTCTKCGAEKIAILQEDPEK
jgi:hypothetical protein